MLNQRCLIAGVATVSLCLLVSIAVARGPKQQGGPPAAADNGNAQQGIAPGGNRMRPQNMPTVEQLAQMLLTQYDADGSSTLDQAELQTALEGLRQMMMQRQAAGGAQQQQMGGPMPQNQNGMAGGGRRGPGGGQGGEGGGRRGR